MSDIIISCFFVALPFIFIMFIAGSDENDRDKSVEKKRITRYGTSDEWHCEIFQSASQFTAWMNNPETKPICGGRFEADDFLIFPVDGEYYVVYRD